MLRRNQLPKAEILNDACLEANRRPRSRNSRPPRMGCRLFELLIPVTPGFASNARASLNNARAIIQSRQSPPRPLLSSFGSLVSKIALAFARLARASLQAESRKALRSDGTLVPASVNRTKSGFGESLMSSHHWLRMASNNQARAKVQ